ncbi:MAG: DUF3341 domain-containing protein [Phycisphaerales bacterium]|nr:DUF3341 domain-containing protein [Planctomycetota bacterium]
MAKNAKVYVTESGENVFGVIAEFATAADIYHAAEKVRDAGYTRWDVYAPFPIHGIDTAMGVKRTRLPLFCAACGLTGAGLGFLMQWWMSGVDYQMVVQGKPYGAWEPFVPITFELGILFTAFSTLLGMLAFNGLPRHNHPLMRKERFLGCSDDTLAICIESADDKFDPEQTRAMLERLGGKNIDLVEGD